ncbi:MAG: 23S rRNA (uracil(1939)-C(5))-methyltransferase RlmD [Colwellia sp.]|nr:23S rRNA (uracil(1939)-C(5))-methyltransferase RlmD [Colwellia sp.]
MANFYQANKKKQIVGQIVDLKIERLDLNGCGVARLNDKPVFIDQALPKETVKVKIIEQKSKYLRGKIIEIATASKDRVSPLCKHYRLCGGCDLQHLVFSEHLAFKQKKVADLFQRNQINQSLPWQNPIASTPWHYRRKARLGVQYDKQGHVTLGFRQKGTNQLTAIKQCHVLVENISSIFIALKKVLDQLVTSRSVGHIEVIDTGKITLVIRQMKKLNDTDKALWQLAEKTHQWQVLIDEGEQVTALTEKQPLKYKLLNELELTFNSQDFIQINHQVNQQMVQQAMDWLSLTATDVVLDLFCGLGNFSISFAQKVKQVIGIEGIQSMVDRAATNAINNKLDNCQFYQADLNADWLSQAWANIQFDKVLLDPARAGAFEALEQLVKFKVPCLLYVSCEPTTLARDAKYLISQGYKIEKIALIEMFSQTKHVETMVLFSR